MNYDDFDAAHFVVFEDSLSPELDDDFNTLYSSLENLVGSTEKSTSRSFTVTSEYVPASVESSFELGEEYSTDLGDEQANPNAGEMTFRPESFVCSTEKKRSRIVALKSECVSVESSFEPGQAEDLIDFSEEPANSNAGKTALDYLEKALSEFVQFQTDPQISSASLSKEVENTCSEDTRHASPMNLPSDLTYRISSAVTPSSCCGSPLSKNQHVLLSSEEYESCLNRTGQNSLIGAMETLKIKSARKIKRNRQNLEDFDGNSEIAIIVTSYGSSEASNSRDRNCEGEQSADQTEISPRSKSDMENSSSAHILENRATGRTHIIGEEDNSEIVKTVPSYEIPEASDFRDKNCEDERKSLPAETSLRSKWDIENLLFLAHIAENQTTGRTYMIGQEENSEIAATIQPYGIPESSNFRDKNAEEKESALPMETDVTNASSNIAANIAETQTTGKPFMCGKEDKSDIVETVTACRILEAFSSMENIEETPRVPEDNCSSAKSVHPAVSAEQKKKRKNPRVLTSQVRRQSLKYRRSSGQFVSMAEAMLKFQKGTPKRFRSTVKKNQKKPTQPKIKSLQRVTCPVSPALRCKFRARPSRLPNQEEREMLEIEEARRNRFKATKSPAPQKSIAPSEKSAASSSKDSNLLSAGELKTLPRRATPRRKTLVKSVVSTEDGPEMKDIEIFNFGVPIPRTKSPLTKPEPFSFEKREKKILEKREEHGAALMKDEKRRTIHQRSSATTSTVTSGSSEGAARKPIDLTFRERNELLLAKKKLITDRAREKQAWVFHARLAPPVKQVLVRGTSAENLGSARVAPTLKPARGTSTENLGPAKVAPMTKQLAGPTTSTENSFPPKVGPKTKQLAEPTTSTENLGLAENKQKTRGLSPAERSRGLSPAERSRGLSPAGRSRGLSPAERSRGLSAADRSRGSSAAGRSRGLSPAERPRGSSPAERSRDLSPSIADRENQDPNVSSMSNQCPKLKAPLSLYTEDRSKKRQEFDATRRRKDEEAEEQRREYEAYRLAQEKREERELRRTMESRARPMPVFKQPKIAKSLKPLTDPQSPAWSWKKTKK